MNTPSAKDLIRLKLEETEDAEAFGGTPPGSTGPQARPMPRRPMPRPGGPEGGPPRMRPPSMRGMPGMPGMPGMDDMDDLESGRGPGGFLNSLEISQLKDIMLLGLATAMGSTTDLEIGQALAAGQVPADGQLMHIVAEMSSTKNLSPAHVALLAKIKAKLKGTP